MRDCPTCHRWNAETSAFCTFCGASLVGAAGVPPPPAPLPPSSSLPIPPPPPEQGPVGVVGPSAGARRFRHRTRFVASLLLMVGVLLVLVALVTPWWSASISIGSSGTWTGYLMPGTAASSCSGDCGSLYATCGGNYCYGASDNSGEVWNTGLSSTNGLYEGVLVLLILSLLAGFLAVLLGLRGAYGSSPGRRLTSITMAAGFVAMLFSLLALSVATLGQPSALSHDFSNNITIGGWFCATGSSPTNAFWGSNSGSCAGGGLASSPVTYSWGASVGWYAALLGVLLLALATLMLFREGRAMSRSAGSQVPITSAQLPPPAVPEASQPAGIPPGAELGFPSPPPPPPPT